MARKSRKQKYYSLDDILKLDAHYNHIIGMRSGGKSYAVKKYMIDQYLDNDIQSIYLRRYADDLKGNKVELYFADMIPYLKEKTGGKLNEIKYNRGTIFLCHRADGDSKTTDNRKMGFAMAVNQAERYKSTSYPQVEIVTFEEYLSLGDKYLGTEIDNFESIISTVSRRDKIKVFLIGNKMSRNSPYFKHYQLLNVGKQKAGTIDKYEYYTNPPQFDDEGNHISILHAVEVTEELSQNTNMFFGNSQKAISNDAWVSQEQPRINFKEMNTNVIYEMVVEFRLVKFFCRFCFDYDTNNYFWYVEPKTTFIKDGTRVITDRFVMNPSYTNGFIPLGDGEKKIFHHLLYNGEVYYSDNLTGTEFIEAMQELR